MTLACAWYVHTKESQSLLVASDSCLSGGERWTCCPKIFPLARQDSAICFAGDTFYAYPLILQLINTIDMHPKIKNRALDATGMQKYIQTILNSMITSRHSFPSNGPTQPNVDILFCAYSWRFQAFFVWHHFFKNNKFYYQKVIDSRKDYKRFIFIGDYARNAALILVDKYNGGCLNLTNLKTEPLDIINKFIQCEDREYDTIAGPIQMVKIYSHMNTLPFNIITHDDKGNEHIYFYGRELQQYEKNKFLGVDIDTKDVFSFPFTTEREKRYNLND